MRYKSSSRTVSFILTSFLAFATSTSAQVISLLADGDFSSLEVELNGLDFAGAFPDSQTANANLYFNHYGAITTGNTLGR